MTTRIVMERPTHIDIPSQASSRAPSSAASSRTGQPSPRIQHYHGDIPPTLSPLDAIAAQSRRLAKELEATRIAGEKRMSRLPPALVTHSLTKHQANRPAIFRSLSSGLTDPSPEVTPKSPNDSALNPTFTQPSQRPVSSYPRISAVLREAEDENEEFVTPREEPLSNQPTDYFGSGRTNSPIRLTDSPIVAETNALFTSNGRTTLQNSDIHVLEGLAPPNAAFARNKTYAESSDDDYQSSNGGSTFSQPRKMSQSSGISFPMSPALAGHDRKPSNDSSTSLTSQKNQRSHLNFSRPMSQTSLNLKFDSPSQQNISRFLERKPSQLSEMSRDVGSFDDERSVLSDGFITGDANSYTHKKFTLPRGRHDKVGTRNSLLFSGLSTPDFIWQEPLFPSTPPLSAKQDGFFLDDSPSSDSPRKGVNRSVGMEPFRLEPIEKPKASSMEQERRPSSSRGIEPKKSFDFGSRLRPSTSYESTKPKKFGESSIQRRPSTSYNANSFDKTKMPALPPIPGSTVDTASAKSTISAPSARSESTIRPSTARSVTNYQALSTDEHVDKAIALHQAGDLKESTYHLRIAAKQDDPTAMLLYALACRHGWGMRANQKEGVEWLRRAVNTAMLEVAEDEDPQSSKPKPDFHEQKSHRAQFALTVYELGISHLNGWGIEQDKALALRCFEIAGSWGDTDALTEAGFCYAQGIGCKKDLKKAAKIYRTAAEKGVSMVGNSWIYKDKYLDKNDDDDKTKTNNTTRKSRSKSIIGRDAALVTTKKPRDKSRTRSIWGKKKDKDTVAVTPVD